MIKIKQNKSWLPDYMAESVVQIDADELRKAAITHLVFDLDNTLLIHKTNELSAETVAYIAGLRQAGFKIILGSNTRRDTDAVVEAMQGKGVRVRGLSMKPFKSYYKKVIAAAETEPEHIAMIGDHLINDVIGANRAGLKTILVKSLSRRTLTFNAAYIQWLKKYAQKT
ncbi:MAG TPA: YqeG family HAD IIIA-type phosphatase [Candidatus Saccharimonadales bacterium]|nr:YqeG family HAD IIIA-type phosphatase [Candidatus Saccharimonadales bacterium]